jgi:transposase
LRAVLRTPSASQQQALRARIVLRAAEGATNTQIALEAGVSLPTVGLWRRNFSERGIDGLADAPRSGRPREIDDDEVQRVLAKTLERPSDGSTHWSVRRLAAATGISPTTVHRIWRDHKLKPHQVRSFKFSSDPRLAEKVVDVVGQLLAEARVIGQLERAHTVRLQAMRVPDSLHPRRADALGLGHRTTAPVCLARWRRLRRGRNDLADLHRRDRSLAPATRLHLGQRREPGIGPI